MLTCVKLRNSSRNRGRAKSPIQDHVTNGRAERVNGCLLVSSSGTLLGTEEEQRVLIIIM
jgi:hypothetical protein